MSNSNGDQLALSAEALLEAESLDVDSMIPNKFSNNLEALKGSFELI